MEKPKVLISVLNWNKALLTLKCIDSLLDDIKHSDAEVTILAIDNGSHSEDRKLLEKEENTKSFVLLKLPENLGFTGGHNVAIQKAFDANFDYIWLLNNDSQVEAGALSQLLMTMLEDSSCGAASPVIRSQDNHQMVAACLNIHNWHDQTSTKIKSIQEAKHIQEDRPEAVWLYGTAIFFRVEALRRVGKLNDRLFAYYDDDDIGARLSVAGWRSKCVFDASVMHDVRHTYSEYPPYYFFLMQRNEMLFWFEHTPAKYRRFLWIKLIDSALFNVNRLYRAGLKAQGDAALLGVRDFVYRRFGKPSLERKVPLILSLACKLSAILNARKVIPSNVATTN